MGIGESLRRLDERVLLPKPKPGSAQSARNVFLVGLVGTLVVLLVLMLTGRWSALGGIGGFLGIMIAGGARWYRASHPPREQVPLPAAE